jgi:hypothetical protein
MILISWEVSRSKWASRYFGERDHTAFGRRRFHTRMPRLMLSTIICSEYKVLAVLGHWPGILDNKWLDLTFSCFIQF